MPHRSLIEASRGSSSSRLSTPAGSDITNDEVTVFALPLNTEKKITRSTQVTTTLARASAVVAGSSAAGARAQPKPPPGPGLELITQHCINCHPATQIFSAPRRTSQEWSKTVKRMVARGAELTPDEARTFSDYLGGHLAPPTNEPDTG
jgi:cytochrome c5